MERPRLSALTDSESRLRRDWLAFVDVWQRSGETWKDHRRAEFEKQHLSELPATLSLCQAQLNQFRELLQHAYQSISDSEALE